MFCHHFCCWWLDRLPFYTFWFWFGCSSCLETTNSKKEGTFKQTHLLLLLWVCVGRFLGPAHSSPLKINKFLFLFVFFFVVRSVFCWWRNNGTFYWFRFEFERNAAATKEFQNGWNGNSLKEGILSSRKSIKGNSSWFVFSVLLIFHWSGIHFLWLCTGGIYCVGRLFEFHLHKLILEIYNTSWKYLRVIELFWMSFFNILDLEFLILFSNLL